jgi:hypothetical protein
MLSYAVSNSSHQHFQRSSSVFAEAPPHSQSASAAHDKRERASKSPRPSTTSASELADRYYHHRPGSSEGIRSIDIPALSALASLAASVPAAVITNPNETSKRYQTHTTASPFNHCAHCDRVEFRDNGMLSGVRSAFRSSRVLHARALFLSQSRSAASIAQHC